jgi:YrbI family 3-deoxy-D-manno-octulosonate 8-phosphate phosphatase
MVAGQLGELRMQVLAIIPARGGSKSIPRKNIKPLAGHPLVAYSIAAALQAKCVTRTIVSTDDEEIAAVARQYGAETPFLRPAEYAQDQTTDLPVFQHALAWFAENEAYVPDIIVQLRPTSPIRPPDCVDQAVKILTEHPGTDSVRGVVPSGQNPFKMWRIDEEGKMTPLLSVPGIQEPFNAPRQALPATFWQTGHIDAIWTKTVNEQKSLSGKVIFPLILDSRYTIDIDTLKDWQRAESMIFQRELSFVQPGSPAKPQKRSLPERVELVVFDFDGVMTDNRVWVDQDGREMVAANRSDSLGLTRMRQAGIEAFVLSREINPVVAARCRKMNIPYIQGETDKATALQALLIERKIDPAQVVYVGNDINDLPCFPIVGCAVAVADALPEVCAQADLVLQQRGGHGAVREICDLIYVKTLGRSST